MKTMNHALISNYHESKKKRQMTAEDFRRIYDIIIEDHRLTEFANGRTSDVVSIRQAIMRVARENTNLTLKEIGSIWGKHYSTIIHGLENVKKAHETNDELYLDWQFEVNRYFSY